jgi:hypothetical protein
MIYLRLAPVTLVALAAAAAASAGCSSSDASGRAPEGLSCESSQSASDTDAARSALASAKQGSCVILTGASYAGPFAVPAGVAIAASSGSRATISGGTEKEPAVTLAEGSALANVDVTGARGVAIAVRAGSASITNVKVSGAKTAALAVLCQGDPCASGVVQALDSTFEKSGLGVWISNAHVVLKGGKSSEHSSESLSAAAGVVVQNGAAVTLEGFTVEKNQGAGVLIDGASTKAVIKGSTISENGERGVWIQRTVGTIDAPAVRIEESQLVKNKIVGLGSVEARGIIVIGGRVAETVAAPVVTNLATTEQVGDGVGIFGGSTDVKIDGSTLEANMRAAGVVDGSDRGIIVIGGNVAAGPSGLKIVIQNTKDTDVQVPEANKSTTTKPLGVSAPKLQLPPIAL